jgi:hypothetical protein
LSEFLLKLVVEQIINAWQKGFSKWKDIFQNGAVPRDSKKHPEYRNPVNSLSISRTAPHICPVPGSGICFGSSDDK